MYLCVISWYLATMLTFYFLCAHGHTVLIIIYWQLLYSRSICEPSFLKTYSSAACNMTATHDECAVDCTMLVRNIPNLSPKTFVS